jgi:hypothetical protein
MDASAIPLTLLVEQSTPQSPALAARNPRRGGVLSESLITVKPGQSVQQNLLFRKPQVQLMAVHKTPLTLEYVPKKNAIIWTNTLASEFDTPMMTLSR